jgi:hypothetical protein
VAENILSLPMQIPLGLAMTEVIAETGIPTIAHHHDFFWERERYRVNAAGDYLQTAFPPRLPGIAHVVINTAAREEMARRTGLAATVVPNGLDFAAPPAIDWEAVRAFRDFAGLAPDDTVVLQPTRIVQRKGIEQAVNLVRALNRPACKLVISHPAGDEGYGYARWIERYARSQAIDLVMVDAEIDDPWGTHTLECPPVLAQRCLSLRRCRHLPQSVRGIRQCAPGGHLFQEAAAGEPLCHLHSGHRAIRIPDGRH